MNKILFVDSDPLRAVLFYQRINASDKYRVIWVRSVKEAIQSLKENSFDHVHLENDLDKTVIDPDSQFEFSGMEVVRWVIKRKSNFNNTLFHIHTWNIRAGEEMAKKLLENNLFVVVSPFGLSKI